MTATDAEEAARLASIAGLGGMSPARLRAIVQHHSPEEAVEVVRGDAAPRGPIARLLGSDTDLRRRWRADALARPPDWYAEALDVSGVSVVRPEDPQYPPQLFDDPRRPELLFARGDLTCLDARRVGVVGTRNATHQGRMTARRLGRELAEDGVTVVSGLALGVDGASHEGALTVEGARPAAVVGSGPDVPYPKRHRALWNTVADRGVVISEWPPGSAPVAYHFPLRNRILAALSEVLVVVESRDRGGSLITAQEAADRGVEVLAVPGALSSPASAGTVRLIRDGAQIFTETADVLVALGLDTRRAGRAGIDPRPVPLGPEADLLGECRAGPITLERAAVAVGLTISDAAAALGRLERQGWLREEGGWYEATE